MRQANYPKYKVVKLQEYEWKTEYTVLFKKKWWQRWKYVKRYSDETVIMSWRTKKGAETYVKFNTN